MLRKIRVDQLQLGMQLHELCVPWLDHPFWQSKFLLSKPEDLARARASGVGECWIDTDKGVDLAERASATADTAPAPAQVLAAAPARGAILATARVSIEDEAARAAALLQRARPAVQALFDEVRMGRALEADRCVTLVEEISASVSRNPGALISLARLKSHSDYTFMHSISVCALMIALARQLGKDEAFTREAGMAGLLHDLGKAMMPVEVLNKPGSLSAAEYEVMKTHPRRGHALLAEGRAASAIALEVCLHHHERPDGAGYPDGLAGEALALEARMGAICDVYDAITSNRPYKAGWDPAESMSRMAEGAANGQFDPAVFQAFVKCMGIYPIGSLVRLRSGRLAVVVEQHPDSAIAPRVKIFFSTRSKMPVAPEFLDLSRPACSDRIVARESNERWGFPHLTDMVSGFEALRQAFKVKR